MGNSIYKVGITKLPPNNQSQDYLSQTQALRRQNENLVMKKLMVVQMLKTSALIVGEFEHQLGWEMFETMLR